METQKSRSWCFSLEFDADKAARNGCDLETLYDSVGRKVEPYGLTRTSQNTWNAKPGDEVSSQCLALSMPSKTKWVMRNIRSLTVWEDDAEGFDGLEVIRRTNPERLAP